MLLHCKSENAIAKDCHLQICTVVAQYAAVMTVCFASAWPHSCVPFCRMHMNAYLVLPVQLWLSFSEQVCVHL